MAKHEYENVAINDDHTVATAMYRGLHVLFEEDEFFDDGFWYAEWNVTASRTSDFVTDKVAEHWYGDRDIASVAEAFASYINWMLDA